MESCKIAPISYLVSFSSSVKNGETQKLLKGFVFIKFVILNVLIKFVYVRQQFGRHMTNTVATLREYAQTLVIVAGS